MGDCIFFFFFQAEDGIRDKLVTGVQTCALPISPCPGCICIMCAMCSSCIAIGSGRGNRTAGEISGLPPPEYQTTTVWTASVFPGVSARVEFRAPACSPPVALLAPTGEEETVSNATLGVEISGM